jgi:hypothetical protein
MKYTILLILTAVHLMAALIKAPVVDINEEQNLLKVKLNSVQKGMSGYVVHTITPEHSAILKNVVVTAYDATTQTATLKMSDFDGLRNNSLPYGKWSVAKGDIVELAFGYTRALLIAPNEELYHKISQSVQVEWVHPDLFATVLSFEGHPTPLKSDFVSFANSTSAGLLFIYLDKRIYTVDIKSFAILNIVDAPLEQKSEQRPFYSRVKKIDAAWWGEGSSEMDAYAPHYYELLVANNKENKKLYEIVKNAKDERVRKLSSEFEIGK